MVILWFLYRRIKKVTSICNVILTQGKLVMGHPIWEGNQIPHTAMYILWFKILLPLCHDTLFNHN